MTKTRARIFALTLALASVLALPVAAHAVDDNIPGVPVSASPLTGTLDADLNVHDVYSIDLAAGQVLRVQIQGPVGTDFDARLFAPGATDVTVGAYVASAERQAYPDVFGFRVLQSGTYYLDIYAYSGAGAYTVQYSFPDPATFDDDFPGLLMPASPFSGTLDALTDFDDVFYVDLTAGQTVAFTLTSPYAATDFDMYLYKSPDWHVNPVAWAEGSAYPNTFVYTPSSTGRYYLDVYAFSGAGSYSVTYSAKNAVAISGANRIGTAIAVSQKAFARADTVVIATAANWPDALGGSALAGAYNAPVLLTNTASLPSELAAEITHLGATNAIILGGTGAVSGAVQGAIGRIPGVTNVERIGGANRYATANMVASRTIQRVVAVRGTYDGTAFVATGGNFPDALGASPLAAAKGWPIYLANPAGGDNAGLAATMQANGVRRALVLGGTGVVNSATAGRITAAVGGSQRLAGANRYATAVAVANHGVANAGLAWNGVAIATGANFPDALAGGVLQGKSGSVMLLTPSAKLDAGVASTLAANKANIAEYRFLGGTTALSSGVRSAVAIALN